MLLVQESQGVLLFGASGLPPDGQDGRTLILHLFVESLPMREALGITASTYEHEVQVLPHMAEGSMEVLIENSQC